MKNLTLTLCALTLACQSALAVEAHPFPQHALYAAGTIRPTNFSQAVQDNDVRTFYNAWKAAYVTSAGTVNGKTLYRIAFGKSTADHARTVSEGQGYGMVIVALMAGHDPAAKTIFDGLHAYALAHPSTIDRRLMGWEIPNSGGADSAFDGDADIAYALTLAYAQWGSAEYLNAANTRLAGILTTTIGPQSRLPTLGDWVGFNDAKFNQYCPRSSDIMPGHFRSWARFTGNSVWNTVANNCSTVINTLQANYSPNTGLLPGFIINANPLSAAKPSGANYLEAGTDGMYDYNAGRDPWRIATDALLNNNAASKAQALKMTNWAKIKMGGNPQNVKGPYKLDGNPTSSTNGFTTFFAAPFGVAAMLDANNQAWLNAIYAKVRTTHEDYYEDSVNLQCLLTMTGNYWDPTTIGGTPADTQIPTTPTSLRATPQSSRSIALTWTASSDNVGVTGYFVYRGSTQVGTTTGTTYTDTGLSPSTNYSYTIKAKDAAGNTSVASTPASATTLSSGTSGFLFGIDLNGPAVTIEGNLWRSHANALTNGLTITSALPSTSAPLLGTTSITPSPAVDAPTSAMLNSVSWAASTITYNQTIPNGPCFIYLWSMENYQSNFRAFNVVLEGSTVATSIGTLAKNSWKKYGPYAATVSDGQLNIQLNSSKGNPGIMGIAIYSGTPPALANTHRPSDILAQWIPLSP